MGAGDEGDRREKKPIHRANSDGVRGSSREQRLPAGAGGGRFGYKIARFPFESPSIGSPARFRRVEASLLEQRLKDSRKRIL